MKNMTNLALDVRNFLNRDEYLISDELQYSLEEGKFYNNSSNDLNEFNLVIIGVLNKNNNILVYNYISYNIIFLNTFVHFAAQRPWINGNLYKEPGDFLGVIDNSLLGGSIGSPLELSRIVYNFDKLFQSLSDSSSYYSVTNAEIINLINKLVLQVDGNSIPMLIDLAIKKDYKNFIYEVLNSEDSFNKFIKDVDFDESESINIINGCYFVVKDLNKFIDNIRSKNYNINAGPQPHRGRVNSINNSLSILDMEYRKSLYNHNNYHVSTGKILPRLRLNKEKFSFNNIHMNLGNVRWSSTFSRNRILPKDRDGLLEICFHEIDDILKQKNIKPLTELQEDIENLLFEGQTWFNSNKKSISNVVYSSKTYDFITENKNKIYQLLSNPDEYSGNTKTHGTEYIPKYLNIIKELGQDDISDMLIQYFLYIVTNESIKVDDDIVTPGIPSIFAYDSFGKRVTNRYIYSRYLKSTVNYSSFSEFKDSDDEYKLITSDSNFNARVGGFFIYTLIECGLLKLVVDKKFGKIDEYFKQMEYIRLTNVSRDIIINESQHIFHTPSKLPMICPPKEYKMYSRNKKMRLGGYLLNDVKYTNNIFIDKVGYGKPTQLKDNNTIIDMINGLNRTPYKINTDTLNYIYKYGIEKSIIIDSENEKIRKIMNNPHKSTNKKTGIENRSIISKINLQRNILNIAELYSDMNEIYFPVRMDNRTRIYCITDYFDYQKNDLAKGLISFSNPGTILKTDSDVIKYFKAFGANMFGTNLDKKSLNYRVSWVDENSDYILDFENNDIVNKAENKSCFISFCFEYKRFIEFMSNDDTKIFYTFLPIQLDASCNGYQHLTLLTREKNLLNVLNLASSTHDDDPDDFYTYISDLYKKYIKNQMKKLTKIENKTDKELNLLSSYQKLCQVDFDRSIVKKVIMIKSYNAGVPTLVEKVIDFMEDKHIDNKKYFSYKNVDFVRADIVAYIMAIRSVVAKESPRITELSKYIDGVVSICTKLNMPVPWTLPTGVEILGSYEIEQSKAFKAFFFVNTRYTFKSYQRGTYGLSRQKRATMPNIIHSLDATTIGLLYNKFKNIGPMYTIHDCFGVTANNVPKLILKLKLVYTQLYSSSIYLKDFDRFVKTTINKTLGDSVYKMDSMSVTIMNKNNKPKDIPMPDINKVLDKSIDVGGLNKSSNLII